MRTFNILSWLAVYLKVYAWDIKHRGLKLLCQFRNEGNIREIAAFNSPIQHIEVD
ncbi:hypothetical protein VB711_10765 [Cronbergia sp. UHCC 0137]|uniref:hypothetical protein n=1 Tax=Cronbergia sp. UHCC 0137 TaxID=3110239 RepID=UPI002B1F6EBE|nr:hypothetical protein [Cronbergia sp. UHCC 0137]MEA5618314.1 hypothetical protein [Cronbergia sp. UHCC 0137]